MGVYQSFLETSSKLPRSSLEVFKIICNNPNATNKEIGEELGISDRAVRNHIKVLKDISVIKRIGSDRSGYWEIIMEDK